jgi:hypothetical protein
MSGLNALPPIADSALPAAVRSGSEADKTSYKAALGFERLLVGQLVETMTSGSSLQDGPRAGVVADAMADALQGAGGLGLAPHLYEAMKLQEGRR